MRKGIATITSEIILTIIVLSLSIPLIAYINSLEENAVKNIFSKPLTCITYRYIDDNKILLYNDCTYDIKVYSTSKLKINYSILFYNDTLRSFVETSVIRSKGLHLIITNTPLTRIVLNTSHGLLILGKR